MPSGPIAPASDTRGLSLSSVVEGEGAVVVAVVEGGTTEAEAEGALEAAGGEEDEGGDRERARATATAWLAPFPPARRVRFVDERVWPGRTIDGTVLPHVS